MISLDIAVMLEGKATSIGENMATRTAPTVTGSPPYKSISFHLIDHSGDKRAFSVKADVTNATDPAIESVADAIQGATNASLWKVTVADEYIGNALGSNADEAVYASVYDNIVILYKDGSVPVSQNAYIPAPDDAMVADDVVQTGNALYTAVRDAFDAILATCYDAVRARYTERREKYDSVPVS